MDRHRLAHRIRRLAAWAAAVALAFAACSVYGAPATPQELSRVYRAAEPRALDVPPEEVKRYGALAEAAFARAAAQALAAQYVVVVDRSEWVQALLLMWRDADGRYSLVGASPVSTGLPGEFDHFETPTGVFEHSPRNPDFRAEGTVNANGLRGYGAKGMRVFDLGWQVAAKGWGDGRAMEMRLQMHATDPDLLERRLGTRQSKGCIRITADLNRLLDHYGVIDAAYEPGAPASWVLPRDRDPVEGAGRYIVVVDSARSERPDWSPAPYIPRVRQPSGLPPKPALPAGR